MPPDKSIVHVIDDDEAVRQALAFQLGSAGIEVRTYESAVAFLGVAPTVRTGCIITDVRMPELSGIDLLRRLRELKARLAALSNRERDVLKGLVAGHANKQIAYDLGISPRTIENYRANLMIKMQAGSLSDLVRMALVAGILDSNADVSNAS